MREIKFRAWCVDLVDPSKGHMTKAEDIYGNCSGWMVRDLKNDGNYKIMQYTGLKDKNGVEIFEGDVFEFTEAKKRRRGQVVFEDAMFKMKDSDGWGAMTLQNQYDMEVIGNIYEHGHLLEQKDA